MTIRLFATAAAVASLFGGAARADVQSPAVPDAIYNGIVASGCCSDSYDQPGTYTRDGGDERVTLAATPSPYIDVYAFNAGPEQATAASGYIKYFAQLNGPDSQIDIPVNVTYSLRGTGVPSEQGYFDWSVGINLFSTVNLADNARGLQGISDADQARSNTWSFDDRVGVLTTVELNARAYAYLCSCEISQPVSAEAYIDPVFTIDPTFAATHPGYSFSFSQGVGNDPVLAPTGDPVSNAPEPASWALLIIGVGGAGAMLRRGRGAALAAA